MQLLQAIKYMPEKLLASSIWLASNCPHCPNLQSTTDVVWESFHDDSSSCEHTAETASVTETFRLFPQAERVASAVWDPSTVWYLLVLPSSFCSSFTAVCYWNYSCWQKLLPVVFLRFLGTTKTAVRDLLYWKSCKYQRSCRLEKFFS